MATYVLGSIGTAFGGPIGGIIGSILGSFIDQQAIRMLTPNQTTTNRAPRLTEMSLTTSSEGSVVPEVYGRCRFGGQVIWCTEFKETEVTDSQTTGGKGGGGQQTTVNVTYKYSLSFAVAFCKGNSMAQLGRVWIDSKEIDLSRFTFRFYPGSETQSPDPLIQAKEGIDVTSAYRGTAYIVFEDLPLAEFGNRMPQVTAEIVVPLKTDDPDDLSNLGKSWQLIPATGESIYGTQLYTRTTGAGTDDERKVLENMHNNFNEADAVVALDNLVANQPNLDAVSVVVSWFGTDLRAGECRVIPKIEGGGRSISPNEWQVAGYDRSNAETVSYDNLGNPIFGGTPSDSTVVELVQHLKALGKRVVFYPFILMDIPSGNSLPNPYSDNASSNGQAVFPWRGRITCSPAAGYAGTVDKTAAAATQINTWFTRTEGYRAMVLHYANLLDSYLGSGDAFIIGSELVGITQVRSSAGAGTYPGVNQLVTLAADVSAILPSSVKVSYAADWSEYHSHRPADGTNDVIFNMDPLWSSPHIDFVGIDNYLPITDWRDGSAHLDYDAVNGPVSIYDRAYLRRGIEGGEYYDWYYASPAARAAQTRTPIVDGNPANEPWVYRQKDIRNWWLNGHRNRPAGVRAGSNTSWTAQSKPIWFTEFGAPAIDKATNQPNVFYDPKSSESFFPYNSKGNRDDFIQRLYLEVTLAYWRDNSPAGMLSTANMFIWTWDTRPFPAYPMRLDVWSDGHQWVLGHWLNGRIDGVVLARLVRQLCLDAGLTDDQIDVEGLYGPEGLVRGLLLNSQTSRRDIVSMLGQAYQFKGFESEGKLKFVMDINQKSVELPASDLVLSSGQTAPVTITRAQETELPNDVKVSFLDEVKAYQPASIGGKKGTGSSKGMTSMDFPLVWTTEHARALATSTLFQYWTARESGELTLPPSYAALDTGDVVFVPVRNRAVSAQVQGIDDASARRVEFVGFDASLFATPGFTADLSLPVVSAVVPGGILVFMNLPILDDEEPLYHSMRLAAGAADGAWPWSVAVLRDDGAGGFTRVQTVTARSAMAKTTSPFYSGPTQRWDRVNELYVSMLSGGLTSLTEEQVLAGSGNALAIQNDTTGEWEVLQFATATLLSPGSYRLTNLLRGQLGTEHVMQNPAPAGARVVVIDPLTIQALNVTKAVATTPTLYRWGPGSYPVGDPRYVQATKQGTLAGLRPYSPCDFNVDRVQATGDLTLTWKRRTRLNGDSWDQVEVPLIEEAEQYLLEIHDGSWTLVRSEVLTSPTFTYTAAMQTADQGSQVDNVRVKVSQYGAQYGNYGPKLEGQFYMRSAG